MNLKEELEKLKYDCNHYSVCCSCEPVTEPEKLWAIPLDYAIEIAEKYAEEMCKKQKEICIIAAWNKHYKQGDSGINAIKPKTQIQIREDLINAPLATEIKNENNN